jgi:hypothetical protein
MRPTNPLIMKKHIYKHCIVILLCSVMLLTPILGYGQDPSLVNIIVTNTRDNLLLYLTVKDAFPPEIEATLQSGVPVTFSFLINLLRVRGFWLDKELTDIKVTHSLKYDNLKKEYSVIRSWEVGKTHVVKSFEEAKKLMTEVDSLVIISLDQLEKGKQYQIQTKAELSKVTLPFYLHYVLFFVSLWDFETDWYTVDFIY